MNAHGQAWSTAAHVLCHSGMPTVRYPPLVASQAAATSSSTHCRLAWPLSRPSAARSWQTDAQVAASERGGRDHLLALSWPVHRANYSVSGSHPLINQSP